MNNMLSKRIACLLSLAAATVVSAMPVKAQTTDMQEQTIPPANTTPGANELMPQPNTSNQVAQTDIQFGRPTRGGRSYLGVAGNIGFGGETALGEGNFAIISKIGLTNAFSVRPAAIIGDDTTFLIPVTYDFNFQTADPFTPVPIAPYVGAGVAISTNDNNTVNFLLSGGVDVPLTQRFTATAGANVSFTGDTDIGVLIGVGYKF